MILKLDISRVLYQLLCVYAFLLPFEFVLEVFFGIDTVFKPYRIVSLVLIGVFALQVLRRGIRVQPDIKEDIFFYAIFFYGILISLFRIVTGIFNFGRFSNDLFLAGLYLMTFYIFKSLPINARQLERLFQFYVIGLTLNAVYVFYLFFIVGDGSRESGFMDNPNYLALGLVAVMSYLLLKLNISRGLWGRLGYSLLWLFLLYVFIISGSRTGLVILFAALFIIFLFVSPSQKIKLSLAGGVLVLLLLFLQSNRVQLGGPLILLERLNAATNAEQEDVRFVVWRGAFQALEQEGYLGLGIGQFKAKFSIFFAEESDIEVMRMVDRGYFLGTHNEYLNVLTDYGLPGLLCFFIFLVLSFKKSLARLSSPAAEQKSIWRQLSFIVLCCLIFFGLAATSFTSPHYWFLLMWSTKHVTFADQPMLT